MHQLSDYHFELPAAQIAQTPPSRRGDSRLLVVGSGEHDALRDEAFASVGEHLPADAVLVVNDTRVIAARLRGRKRTGGSVELVLVEPSGTDDRRWRCLARASKALRPGMGIDILSGDQIVAGAEIAGERDGEGHVEVELSLPALELCERAGEVPLPPYIARPEGPTAIDSDRYQTVFAREPGAVAAPTAGLHFTTELMDALVARGATVAPLTLHVGPGTFAPVRTRDLDAHRLHAERFTIPPSTAEAVNSGRPVVAVGTTSVRALEAAADGGVVAAGPGRTDLFIRPGYRFQVVDRLITNFHLPESTLLMLVCAFAGYESVMAAYRHAVAAGYRFYSYGDAMLLARAEGGGRR